MKKILLAAAGCMFLIRMHAQLAVIENPFQQYFDEAYMQYPEIPQGLLEAVAYTNTRFQHLDESLTESCTGMPRSYGVMGLIENGKGYFTETLKMVADVSGKTTAEIKTSPQTEILAYARTFSEQLDFYHKRQASVEEKILLLDKMTEIPLHLEIPGNRYAEDAFLFSVYTFLSDQGMQRAYHFPNYKLDKKKLFGVDNFKILSSGHVVISPGQVTDEQGNIYQLKSADYGPALWNPAASCNYSSRNGTAVSAVTIHTVQGTYSGCISWFQNCSASVSAHYVLRSSDGQITQMVTESDKAWHVGSENPYTIGLEHEGYVSNPSWYTVAMYTTSAALVSDITGSGYGINPLRTAWWPWAAATQYNAAGIPGSCTKIKGHQHYPNQTHTDPGANWDWNYYFSLINPAPPATVYTAASGSFFDSGGSSGSYANDERTIWTIAPVNASSVTVTFTAFSLENTWDYLYIYDGTDISAPLIGYYTGTGSPGTVTSSGNALTFEFRSDCATIASGWAASWSSSMIVSQSDSVAPVTSVTTALSWQTQDFSVSFTDADNNGGSGLEKAYYQVVDFDGTDWYANARSGFLNDEFNQPALHTMWTGAAGTWMVSSNTLVQSDEGVSNSNLFTDLKQDLSNRYMYQFSAMINGSGTNRRAGFHFFCDSAQLTNRGNSYFIWLRVDQSALEFYEVTNDVFTLMHSEPLTIIAGQWYDYKIIYDRTTGKISVYQDNVPVGTWTDPSPITTGRYVSFRNGNSIFNVDNFRVFRSRYANTNTTITVGNCTGCNIRYQNLSPSQYSGRVRSIVADSAGNISAVHTLNINVDWTAPANISFINDGSATDADTTHNGWILEANWPASSDANSDIARYWYAVGTAPGDSNIISWTDNWFQLSFLDSMSLILGTTYYVSVKAENGAGLLSGISNSDGLIYTIDVSGLVGETDLPVLIYPNPAGSYLNLQFGETIDKMDIYVTDELGRVIHTWHTESTDKITLNVSSFSAGPYLLMMKYGSRLKTVRFIKE